MTAAVILAAGASSRLGEPKQLIRLGDETLVDRAVRIATDAGCSPVVVVLGANAARVQEACALAGAVVLIHEDWAEGMASSIRAGVAALPNVAGVVLLACDMPAVTVEHLRAVTATGEVRASSYAGRKGVPAYFPASFFSHLMQLRGDAGARELLQSVVAVPLPSGEVDVDTPADVVLVQGLFVGGGTLSRAQADPDDRKG